MCQENRYFVKNMLLLKNPQFLNYPIITKFEYLIFTKFRNDCDKTVDFLIKAYFDKVSILLTHSVCFVSREKHFGNVHTKLFNEFVYSKAKLGF